MPWIERVRTEQPLDAGVGIDRDNPLTRGLASWLLPTFGGFQSDAGVVPPSVTFGRLRRPTPAGCGAYITGDDGIQGTWTSKNYSTLTTKITQVVGVVPVSASAGQITQLRDSGGSFSHAIYGDAGGTVTGAAIGIANLTSTSVLPIGSMSVIALNIETNVAQKLYVNGVLEASSTDVSGGYTPNSGAWILSGYASTVPWSTGSVLLHLVFTRNLSANEVASISANPWQIFEKERSWEPVAAGGPVTHDTSGALAGQLGSIAGTAAHVAVHNTNGTPTGQLGSVAGSAARLRAFSSTGALTGQGASIVGSAARAGGATTHDTTGTPTGQGSAVVGTAAHVAIHGTSGTLVGTSALLAGTAVHNIPHGTSGDLTGPGSVVVGSALNGLASVTKSGVNRLWLIDYYTKEFAAKERLRNPEPAKTKVVAKKRAAEVAAKVEASVAKAEKDLATLTKSMKDVQDAQVFIYNAIQQAKQAPQAEPVDFMAVAKRYEKKVQQEEHELLLLAMVL